MDDHQSPIKILGRFDNRRGFVTGLIRLWDVHIAFGVDRIVVFPISNRCPSDPCPKELRVSHRIRSEVTAITPAPNPNSIRVNPILSLKPRDRILQVLQLNFAKVLVDRPCVRVAPPSGRSIVTLQHGDTLLSQIGMPWVRVQRPLVLDRGISGATVDMNQDWIPLFSSSRFLGWGELSGIGVQSMLCKGRPSRAAIVKIFGGCKSSEAYRSPIGATIVRKRAPSA